MLVPHKTASENRQLLLFLKKTLYAVFKETTKANGNLQFVPNHNVPFTFAYSIISTNTPIVNQYLTYFSIFFNRNTIICRYIKSIEHILTKTNIASENPHQSPSRRHFRQRTFPHPVSPSGNISLRRNVFARFARRFRRFAFSVCHYFVTHCACKILYIQMHFRNVCRKKFTIKNSLRSYWIHNRMLLLQIQGVKAK